MTCLIEAPQFSSSVGKHMVSHLVSRGYRKPTFFCLRTATSRNKVVQ